MENVTLRWFFPNCCLPSSVSQLYVFVCRLIFLLSLQSRQNRGPMDRFFCGMYHCFFQKKLFACFGTITMFRILLTVYM